jgi:hypothetical protein
LLLQLYMLPVLKLRYDTADNLRLRNILDPSKPQHAAVLASMGSAAGSSSAAGEPTLLSVQQCCGIGGLLLDTHAGTFSGSRRACYPDQTSSSSSSAAGEHSPLFV